mgnify:CR=1 FL=1
MPLRVSKPTIGVVSDIHANIVALDAVLDDMPAVDYIISLGDVVGYGPKPQAAVQRIRAVATKSLLGNHETYLDNYGEVSHNKGASAGIKHARSELTDEEQSWALNRPERVSPEGTGIMAAHGHPDPKTPFKYVSKDSATDLIPYSREQGLDILGVGHSHQQFKLDLSKFHDDAGIVFNPGSVGQPRDGNPMAGYAVADTESQTVELSRVPYDIETVTEQVKAAGLPDETYERLRMGKMPRQSRRDRFRRY